MAATSKLPSSATANVFVTGLFVPAVTAVLDQDLAIAAINAIRDQDADPAMAPLAAIERPAASTWNGGIDLSIEMETGTGKTVTGRLSFQLPTSAASLVLKPLNRP